MEWVEITAKTIEEAKDQALDRLGVDERDAEFEVVEEPRTGIFGRTKGEARVRARVKPTAPRAKVERRDRKKDRPERAERPAGGTGGRTGGRAPKAAVPAADTPAEAESPAPRPARAPRAERPSAAPADQRQEREMDSELAELDLEQQAAIVAEVAAGVLTALGETPTVTTTTVDETTIDVLVDGPGLGFLVGPRGRTLAALNEVTRSVVLRRGNTPSGTRVHLDVAGYRQRRREALTAFVLETAEQVRTTGLPHALEPMGSVDRKLVHDAVADLDGVGSLSEGEDHDRRVVIVPA